MSTSRKHRLHRWLSVEILLTIPLLAKEISHIIDDPIESEKLVSHITTIHAEYRDRGFDKTWGKMEFATRKY